MMAQLTSNNLPVCIDQTKISNVSCDPAQTTSPLGSRVKQENCTGRGEANVRKLRYLERKNNHVFSAIIIASSSLIS